MKFLFAFILAVFWSPYQHSLQSDSILTKHFTNREITQLDGIRTFFNEQVRNSCQNSNNIKTCYQQYFNRLSDPDNFNLNISYTQQQEMYDTINENLFDKIWEYSKTKIYAPSVDSLVAHEMINYNMQGDYMKFLKDVAKEEPYFEQYTEPMEAAGDLLPSLLKGFLYDPSGLDFSNERHQLILAIHFLTFNDQMATWPE